MPTLKDSIIYILLALSLLMGLISASYEAPEDTEIYYYGEMSNKSDSGFAQIDLTATQVYSQILNISSGFLSGFHVSNSNLTAYNKGIYKISVQLSLKAIGNGEYGIKIYQSGIGKNNCYSHFHLNNGITSSKSISCLLNLSKNDNIGLWIDDHANPVNDVTVLSANVNAVYIGD